MMKVLATAIPLLTLMCVCTHATADTFGTGANQFEIEFVEIGDPGNALDTTGCIDVFSSCSAPNPPLGSVDYIYRIGKFEVSRDMFEKATAEGGLGIRLSTRSWSRPEAPATGVSWNEAARFVNWLNTSQGFPAAYKFTVQPGDIGYDANANNIELWVEEDAGFDAANLFRNSQARYVLPSAHEWYKAAYYDPATGDYWDYHTGSNTPPIPVAGGTDPNTAVYLQELEQGPADITQAGGLSPYGVMGLAGNAFEWDESTTDLRNDDGSVFSSRGQRGGFWIANVFNLYPKSRNSAPPTWASLFDGFRVASVAEPVPEPSVADVNGDGEVDLLDFEIIRQNFYMTVTEQSAGDLNFDGTVDLHDFRLWKDNRTDVVGSVAVPEPNCLTMALVMLGLGLRIRRQRSY